MRSLPVPLSPVISTVVRVGAMRSTRSSMPRIAALLPTRFSSSSAETRAFNRRFSLTSSCFSSAFSTKRGQLGRIERLGHEIVGARTHRLDGVGQSGVRRDQDHLGGRAALLGGSEHIETRTVGHGEIREHHRERLGALGDGFRRGAKSRGAGDHESLPFEQDLQHLPETRLVVDHQDLARRWDQGLHRLSYLAFGPAAGVDSPSRLHRRGGQITLRTSS